LSWALGATKSAPGVSETGDNARHNHPQIKAR